MGRCLCAPWLDSEVPWITGTSFPKPCKLLRTHSAQKVADVRASPGDSSQQPQETAGKPGPSWAMEQLPALTL